MIIASPKRKPRNGSYEGEILLETSVLIVGAGPTGLMLANELGRRGIRAMLIDRHSGPAQQTRAMAVHARTLEIYSKLGIADLAVQSGRRGLAANLWAEGTKSARIPLGDMGKDISPFPFVLLLGQDANERILGDHLRHWDVAVQWNTELIALRQESDHVLAKIKLPDGEIRDISAAWLAGCDGSRSAVRELNGIAFPGAPYEHEFFVADTEVTGSMVPEELNVYLWRDGFHLFFPMRGQNRWRVIGILPPKLRAKEGVDFDDVIPAIRSVTGTEIHFKSCDWFSVYRIHHRCTERFRDRRCLLVGDAAHVHSPMGGQGMNTGLQDAYNLAWKLALVVRGQAEATLLDTYEHERMQVARRLLNSTDRAFRLVVSDHRIAGIFRTRIMARIASIAMRFERVRRIAFRTVSQTGIQYRDSPLSRTSGTLADGAPRAGDRFPWVHLRFAANGESEDLFRKLDDTCFNLLLFGQVMAQGMGAASGPSLKVHVIPDEASNRAELARVGIDFPAFYLLRPDGHVGLAGRSFDRSALERWFTDAGISFAR